MIVKETTSEVSFSEDLEEIDYEIAATPEAFRILSRGIYSNPVRAVLRELGTNAMDGHIALELGVYDDDGNEVVAPKAGARDRKFKVILPTPLAPTLTVRDYGCGLAPAQIRKLYRTYFASSKTNSNEFNGSLGLGSKTPFAVASTFNVVSYYNNTKNIYTIMIGSNGKPTVVPVAENIPDDSESGLEITVPINSEDIIKFPSEAYEVYRTFSNPPEVVYSNGMTMRNIEEYLKGNEYQDIEGLRIMTNNKLPQGAYVLQANVLYPLNIDMVLSQMDPADVTVGLFQAVRNTSTPVILEVENGSVQYTASRESLEYNEWTIQNLATMFRDWYKSGKIAYDAIKHSIEKDLSKYAAFDKLKGFAADVGIMGRVCYSADPIKLGDVNLVPSWYGNTLNVQPVSVRDINPCEIDRNDYPQNEQGMSAYASDVTAANIEWSRKRTHRVITSSSNLPSHLMGSISNVSISWSNKGEYIRLGEPPRIIIVDEKISTPALRRAVGCLEPYGSQWYVVDPSQTELIEELIAPYDMSFDEAVTYVSGLDRVKAPRSANSAARLNVYERIARDCSFREKDVNGAMVEVDDIVEYLEDTDFDNLKVVVITSGTKGHRMLGGRVELPLVVASIISRSDYNADLIINLTASKYEVYRNHLPPHIQSEKLEDYISPDVFFEKAKVFASIVEHAQMTHSINANTCHWARSRPITEMLRALAQGKEPFTHLSVIESVTAQNPHDWLGVSVSTIHSAASTFNQGDVSLMLHHLGGDDYREVVKQAGVLDASRVESIVEYIHTIIDAYVVLGDVFVCANIMKATPSDALAKERLEAYIKADYSIAIRNNAGQGNT